MICKVSVDASGAPTIDKTLSELPPLSKEISVDTETTGLDIWTNRLVCVQVSDGESAYVLTDGFERVLPYLADNEYLKIFQNTQFDASMFKRLYGVNIKRQFDTMIAERVLTMGLYQPSDLASLASKYLSVNLEKDTRRSLIFSDYFSEMTDEQIIYAGKDVLYLHKIRKAQTEKLQADNLVKTAKLEFALTPVLVAMQIAGIGFDLEQWAKVRAESLKIKEERFVELLKFFPRKKYREDLFGSIVSDFNPSSSTQLVKEFKAIGIDVPDVSEVTLKRYLRDNPDDENFQSLLTALLSYRNASSSANLTLDEHVSKITGRIHSTPKQLGARSGRLSFEDPNLQNIETAERIRNAFVAAIGKKFADLDLSQIELVAMAELSGDKNMMDAVKRGEDMHTATAKILFNTDSPTKSQRQTAKGCNFAAVFCASPDTFSVSAGIPLKTATEYLEMYHNKFPSIRAFSDSQVSLSLDRGYSINAGHRRRYVDDSNVDTLVYELLERNPRMATLRPDKLKRIALERKYRAMLTNNPVQSTAADVIKQALVDAFEVCNPKGVDIVLTVHDEIILEGADNVLPDVALAVKGTMELAGAKFLTQLPVRAVLSPLSDRWHK